MFYNILVQWIGRPAENDDVVVWELFSRKLWCVLWIIILLENNISGVSFFVVEWSEEWFQ